MEWARGVLTHAWYVFSVPEGRSESSPAFQRGVGRPIDNQVP
jgi:hypothetical protein